MFKVICIFGHVLIVNSRCYVKNLMPLCTFLKLHAQQFDKVVSKSF